MARRIFISYRRGDEPAAALRICEGLSARFGRRHVFFDVDSLLPGGLFDEALNNALDDTDVLIAVIGPRWKELLTSRRSGEELDYVRDEIAGALRRKISVIPVRVGHQGALPLFPNADELPPEIREFVRYQTQDITYESFARDIGLLTETIHRLRKEAHNRRKAAGSLIPQRVVLLALAVIVFGFLTASSGAVGLAAAAGRSDWASLGWFFGQMAFPDFSDGLLIFKAVGVTLSIALWGVMLAGIVSFPLSILCSANLTTTWIAWPVRRMARLFEATNVAILGVLFLLLFGLRPFAAVAALCLHNIGVLTKSFSEAIETADRPIEGVRHTSASWSQVMYAIFPEVRARWIASLCTCFNNNLSGAIVLSALGLGGGIGAQLLMRSQEFDLRGLSAALIITVAAVMVVEMATGQIRRLVGQP
jgi:phosphonate transport system permease protein